MKIEETEIELFDDLSISLVMAIHDGKHIAHVKLLRRYTKDSPNSFLASLVGGSPSEEQAIIYQRAFSSVEELYEVAPALGDSFSYAFLLLSRFIHQTETSGVC